MSSTPVAPAKVSWLKKFGLDVLKVIGIAGGVIKIAEPIIEQEVPASTAAFNLVNAGLTEVGIIEAGFTAAGQGSNSAAKLAAATPAIAQALQEWVTAQFPGYKYVPNPATATQWVNALVAILNDIDGGAATITPSAQALAVAAAVKAATGK